ncbi:MAG: enoyl-CoA hydratase/isomerase family protein, partial [Myxococcales bacterium]|nr:enoyl-CoA hydratase/isomerase family protein [Myxococcales bacterium]
MAYEALLYEVRGAAARITINRAEKRNALSPVVVRELGAALREADADPAARVIVLTGAGDKAFCAGGDLGGDGMGGMPSPLERYERGRGFAELFRVMNGLGKPLVARVNGHALAGGLGLMLGCDLVVASSRAQFGTPEINVGLFPMMIMATIFRNIGRKKGMELLLTGDRIDAAEAERLGMVNRVVAQDELDAAVD